MSEQILEEKDLSVEEYLKMFAEASADYALVVKGSAKLSRIVIKKISGPSGQLFEDTTFIEKTGVQYTIRTVLS
jgi:hypothetical protein